MVMANVFTHQQWKSAHREKKTEAHIKLDLSARLKLNDKHMKLYKSIQKHM